MAVFRRYRYIPVFTLKGDRSVRTLQTFFRRPQAALSGRIPASAQPERARLRYAAARLQPPSPALSGRPAASFSDGRLRQRQPYGLANPVSRQPPLRLRIVRIPRLAATAENGRPLPQHARIRCRLECAVGGRNARTPVQCRHEHRTAAHTASAIRSRPAADRRRPVRQSRRPAV